MQIQQDHLHKRKRIYQNLAPYPHSDKLVRFFDTIVLIAAFFGPFLAVPQILQIYTLKSASGVSALTWAMYGIFQIPWFIYGCIHKEKPIIVSAGLGFITNALVVILALVYG